jgi:hypothetical protein
MFSWSFVPSKSLTTLFELLQKKEKKLRFKGLLMIFGKLFLFNATLDTQDSMSARERDAVKGSTVLQHKLLGRGS